MGENADWPRSAGRALRAEVAEASVQIQTRPIHVDHTRLIDASARYRAIWEHRDVRPSGLRIARFLARIDVRQQELPTFFTVSRGSTGVCARTRRADIGLFDVTQLRSYRIYLVLSKFPGKVPAALYACWFPNAVGGNRALRCYAHRILNIYTYNLNPP